MIIIIIVITTTIFIVLSSWQSHCESSLGSRDEYRNGTRCQIAADFWTKITGLSRRPALQAASKPYPPSPFIIITQPENWYSFYRPTEGRRLSRPRWLLHTEMVYPPNFDAISTSLESCAACCLIVTPICACIIFCVFHIIVPLCAKKTMMMMMMMMNSTRPTSWCSVRYLTNFLVAVFFIFSPKRRDIGTSRPTIRRMGPSAANSLIGRRQSITSEKRTDE